PRPPLHPDVRDLGLGARDDHRATLRCDRSLVRLCERGGALRCDPFARADRRALLALGAAFHRARAPGRRLRRARGGLLARGNARWREGDAATIGLTWCVTRVLNGHAVV